MEKKKILIVNANPHWQIGGMETYTRHLIDAFLGAGHEVFELSQTPKEDRNDIDHPRFRYVHHDNVQRFGLNESASFLSVYLKVYLIGRKVDKIARKLIKNEKIDVVIDNNFSTHIKFVKGVKYIYVQHFD